MVLDTFVCYDISMTNNVKTQSLPKVSIVMPVYNAEKYLEETLDCLYRQTFQDFELICVNDGSVDHSLCTLEVFRQKFGERMRVISMANCGPGAARNVGLELIRGEYLMILDADDIYEPEMLTLALKSIENHKADLVVFRSDAYQEGDQRYTSMDYSIRSDLLPEAAVFSAEDVKQNIFELFVGWTWDKLIRTAFIQEAKLKFQELYSTDDAFFTFMAIIRAKRLCIIDKILAHHRITKHSVSNTREASWDNFYTALLGMREQMQVWGVYERFKTDFINYAMNFSLWHLMTLKGDVYYQLFDKLTKEWWQELGVTDQDAEFFYSKWHFEQFQLAMKTTAEEFLFSIKAGLEQDKERMQWHLQDLTTENKELREQLDELELQKRQIEHDLKGEVIQLESEIIATRSSITWRVGRFLTYLPGKIKVWLNRK